MTEIDYDRKMIEEMLNKCSDKEGMREIINVVTELLNKPTKDVTKTFYHFKMAGLETIAKHEGNLDIKTMNAITKTLTSSFICGVMGNLMNVFELSPEDMQRYVDVAIKQTDNILKQREDPKENI